MAWFDKYDRIVYKTKEEVDRLLEWRDKNKDLVRNFGPVLENGVIEIREADIVLIFERKNPFTYKYRVFLTPEMESVGTIEWNCLTQVCSHQRFVKKVLIQGEEVVEDFTQSLISIHCTSMAYMEHFKETKGVISSRRENFSQNKGKKTKKGKNNIRKMGRTVYTIDTNLLKETLGRVSHKEYERRTDSWSVRGHWRTLKSGKRTWVKPHIKGNTEKSKPAVYTM